MRTKTTLLIACAFFSLLVLWSLWPLLISIVLGMGLPQTLSCDRIDVLAKIGDSYGSLNSIAAITAATAAGISLLAQRRQITQIEKQQTYLSAMQLVALYYSLDADTHTSQRIAILAALVDAAINLDESRRKSVYAAIRPTSREMGICKTHQVLSKVNWNTNG